MKKKPVDKNKIDFCSLNTEILLLLNELRQQKQYQIFSSTLSLIGNFDGEIELSLYDTMSKDDCNKIVLCFFDLDDNLFTICPVSKDKKDLLKFTKEDNNGQTQYDLSLAKKF